MTTRHVADITDPVTGETSTLSAGSEQELEQLVAAHLEQHYPTPQDEDDPEPAGMGSLGEADQPGKAGSLVGGGR